MIASSNELDILTKVLTILLPFSLVSSVFVFIFILYQAGRRESRYLLLIRLLAFANIPLTIQANLALFSPQYLIDEFPHRIMAVLGGWSAFLIIWLYMICDMELLKLLQVITPKFTPQRIRNIQIIETFLSFLLGGGILIWPFSDFHYEGLVSKWYNFIILLQFISAILIALQCTYISTKMYQFATQKKGQDGGQIRRRTYQSIFQIVVFFVLCLMASACPLSGALFLTDSNPITIRISTLLYNSCCIFSPMQILVYYQIFESIKKIKFEKLINKKKKTLAADI
ncbi:hypothetical protein BC833DRAFT_606198 [Globomyces pollinis-pini]|nr:hypothetical protein BC833DRAFT_606198 [Globomyces pollinis-pini]